MSNEYELPDEVDVASGEIKLSKAILIAIIASGLIVILGVGLIFNFVVREPKKLENDKQCGVPSITTTYPPFTSQPPPLSSSSSSSQSSSSSSSSSQSSSSSSSSSQSSSSSSSSSSTTLTNPSTSIIPTTSSSISPTTGSSSTSPTVTSSTIPSGTSTSTCPTVSASVSFTTFDPATLANRTLPVVTNSSTSTATSDPNIVGSGIYDNRAIPTYIIPKHYTLNFKMNFIRSNMFKAVDYYGEITIEFELTQKVNELLFHADTSLKICDPIRITNLGNGQVLTIRDEIHTHIQNQYYYIRLDSPIDNGKYTIEMGFVKDLIESYSNQGVYLSTYVEDGTVKTIVATKFGPTYARQAFPCFDEPQLKAEFEIILEHPLDTYALSNFDVKKITVYNDTFNPDKYIKTEFHTTFPMSTYLVAWAIVPDDFGKISDTTRSGKTVSVYARKNAIDNGHADFALNFSKQALNYFEDEYFKISDAIPPKVDLIALPGYPAGAMENWGLVGFRETNLLFDVKQNSAMNKQTVALTIAHELAHFWFGNYVTCKLWNDLWLNEAMANFLQYKAVGYISPEWEIDEQTIIEDTLPAMWDDGFESSHPVEANVTTPDEINSVFDSITYSKGSALLRMLESIVGEDAFRDGLRNYLEKNKFGTGDAADFYNILELPDEMKDKTTVEQFMNTWIKQMNYPEVSVVLKRLGDGKTIVDFYQARFLITEFHQETYPIYISPYNYTWEIYLRCTAGGTYDETGDETQHFNGNLKEFAYFLNSERGEIELPEREYTWVKCNKNFKSFYVTDYTRDSFGIFSAILEQKPETFSVGDRANLLHVAYMIAFLGTKQYDTPAELSLYLENYELDYIPWKVLIFHITKIAAILEHRPVFNQLADFGKNLIKYVLTQYNVWEDNSDDEHLVKLLKSSLLDFSCRLQNEELLLKASKEFEKIPLDYFYNPNENTNPVSPNIRHIVYNYHIQNTYDYKDWLNLFEVYALSGDAQEQSIVINALSYSRSTWLLKLYLKKLLKQNEIRSQDFFTVINYVSRNPSGRHLAWNFIRYYWEDIVSFFGSSNRNLGRTVKTVCETFENQFLYEEMWNFFYSYAYAGAIQSIINQAIDAVITNIVWINDRECDIQNNLFEGRKLKKY